VFLAQSFGRLKTFFYENDSSGIIDSRLHGRPQTAHTAAEITKVKDLALIFIARQHTVLI